MLIGITDQWTTQLAYATYCRFHVSILVGISDQTEKAITNTRLCHKDFLL